MEVNIYTKGKTATGHMEVNIYIKGKCYRAYGGKYIDERGNCYRAYGGKYIHKGKMLQGIWRAILDCCSQLLTNFSNLFE